MRLSRNRIWGNPGDDLLPRTLLAQSQGRGDLERHSRRRHFAAARRPDADRPRLAPDRSRRRHLADARCRPAPCHTPSARRCRRSTWSGDGLWVDRSHWSEAQAGIIRAAAEEPEVERIFVNAAIKKALCETHPGEPWMNKVRAYWGHTYHFHIRIKCPAGEGAANRRSPSPPGDGCDKSLAWWFTPEALHPRQASRPPLTMAQLPPECRTVVLENRGSGARAGVRDRESRATAAARRPLEKPCPHGCRGSPGRRGEPAVAPEGAPQPPRAAPRPSAQPPPPAPRRRRGPDCGCRGWRCIPRRRRGRAGRWRGCASSARRPRRRSRSPPRLRARCRARRGAGGRAEAAPARADFAISADLRRGRCNR